MIISKLDCEKILFVQLNPQKFALKGFEISKLGVFLGFLGEYFNLQIAFEVGETIRIFCYFVKSLPIGNQREREIQSEQGFHKKEVSIYRDIFKRIKTEKQSSTDQWCPRFFLSTDDVLVLEDLAVKGYQTLPFRYKFKQGHVEESLKMLARFHSCSLAYDDKNPGRNIGEDFADVLFDKNFSASNPWFQTGFRVIEAVAKFKNKLDNSTKQVEILRQKFDETFKRMKNPSFDALKALCHADGWKNNLMFKFTNDDYDEPNHCLLLDFQFTKYAAVQIDVLMLIILNTRRSHHEQMMNYYLRYYYDHLESELEKRGVMLQMKMTYEKFIKSCDYFKHIVLIYNALSIMITHIPTEIYSQMSVEEYEKFTINNRNDCVLELMNEDSDYNDCVTEAVEELLDYFFEA